MLPFEKSITEANLDYKKEIKRQIAFIILILIGVATIIFFFGKPHFYAMLPLVFLIFIIYNMQRYAKLKATKIFSLQMEFVKLFTYFEIHITNGVNVYNSLLALADFASPTAKEYLETLIAQIDEDKSVFPFIRFGQKFSSLIIEQTMICIYQMIDQGNDKSRLLQFQNIFGKIADQHYADALQKTQKSYDSLNIFPLVGAGVITIMITIGIIATIGGVVSGI